MIAIQPTLEERITDGTGSWCIEQLKINGVDTFPVTYGISFQYQGEKNCLGNISFRDEVVTFPGLNSFAGSARWLVVDDQMRITNADTTAKIFEGKYLVETNGSVMTMKSERVYIRAHLIRFNLPF